jgi:hypothetical protein
MAPLSFDYAVSELGDALSRLSAADWTIILISALAVFTWVWVMGGPAERRAQTFGGAGVAAIVAALLVTAAFTVPGAPHPI